MVEPWGSGADREAPFPLATRRGLPAPDLIRGPQRPTPEISDTRKGSEMDPMVKPWGSGAEGEAALRGAPFGNHRFSNGTG